MNRDTLIAAALALVTVAATQLAGTGDYVLVTPSERICAKDAESCELAREAIQKTWLPWTHPTDDTRCEPSPTPCFSDRSNCIAGYSC